VENKVSSCLVYLAVACSSNGLYVSIQFVLFKDVMCNSKILASTTCKRVYKDQLSLHVICVKGACNEDVISLCQSILHY
jgi:hypothetical protein